MLFVQYDNKIFKYDVKADNTCLTTLNKGREIFSKDISKAGDQQT